MPVAGIRLSWLLGSTFVLMVAALFLWMPDGAAQEVHGVEVGDFFFDPAVLEIEVGDTVQWTHVGSEPHDIVAVNGEFESHPDCDLGSGPCMEEGDTFEWTSTEAGEVDYYCSLHGTAAGSGMAGTLVVQEAQVESGAVAGTVTDADSGDPIAGATVTADGQSSTTDADGDYTIENLEAGEYTVTAEADGYESADQTTTVTGGETTTVDFALDAVTPVPVGPTVELELIADGLTAPVQLLSPPDGSGRLFIVDQVGLIRVVPPDGTLREEPFLDLQDRMVELNPGFDERGALGLAFHPDYATNGRLFVYYSAPLRPEGPEGWNHTSHISEFTVSADPDVADPDSERILLQVDQPQFNHNAGQLMFGPTDGYLYISLGDGGGANDVGMGHTPDLGNAQDITNLLGSILRVDVDGEEPYAIPPDNPFVGVEGRDEIFAYGLRNPYRFTFDQEGDHDLLAGDAGQALWEEVSRIVSGGNYGWNRKEGTHCFDPDNPTEPPEDCPDTGPRGEPLIDPVIEYPNIRQPGGIGVVIIGGHVYRGSDVPQLQGQYVFGDWSTSFGEPDGTLLVATPQGEGLWPVEEVAVADAPDGRLGHFLLGFGEDAAGEMYVLASDSSSPTGDTGKVYQLTSGTEPGAVAGTVTDADSGDPIAGATVTADGQSSTTDADGDYTIEDLEAGEYTVTAEADGYESADQTATVTGGETTTVDFALSAETDTDRETCPPDEVDTAAFTDRDDIPVVHRDNVDCASFHDIVRGFADGSFGPALQVRRDQMAAFIARTLDAAGVELPAATTERFTDVGAASTHDEDIHRLAAADIVLGGPGGLPATSFGPGLRVRRDQMASFLIRAVEFATNEQLTSSTPAFDDVPAGNTHFGTVNAAAELGLAHGFGDGTYRPRSPVRRDQMATFVIRLLTHLQEE